MGESERRPQDKWRATLSALPKDQVARIRRAVIFGRVASSPEDAGLITRMVEVVSPLLRRITIFWVTLQTLTGLIMLLRWEDLKWRAFITAWWLISLFFMCVLLLLARNVARARRLNR